MRTFEASDSDLVVPAWRLFVALTEFVISLALLSRFVSDDLFRLAVISGGILLYRKSTLDVSGLCALTARSILVPLFRLHQRADREWKVDNRDWHAEFVGRPRGRRDLGTDWGTAASAEQIGQADAILQRGFWELVAHPLAEATVFAAAFALMHRLFLDLVGIAPLAPWAFCKLVLSLAVSLKVVQRALYAWLDPERTTAKWRVQRTEQLGLARIAESAHARCAVPDGSWRLDLADGFFLFAQRVSPTGLQMQIWDEKQTIRYFDGYFMIEAGTARVRRVALLEQDSWCDEKSVSEMLTLIEGPTRRDSQENP